MALINGTSGNDRINGEDGADTINGLGGDDSIEGGGNSFTPGDDSINGGEGSDTLGGGEGADTVNGDSGNDSIRGEDGNDVLNGGDGDDTLDGGVGNDIINGGAGSRDIAVFGFSFGAPTPTGVNANLSTGVASDGYGGTDTLINIEGVLGSSASDTLVGDGNDNILDGASGDDVLNGGDGNDSLRGNVGDDVLNGGAGSRDLADYRTSTSGVNANLNTGTASDGFTFGGTEMGGTDTLVNIEDLLGSDHNDTLTGDGNDNVLEGGAGDDVLDGGAGDHDVAAFASAASGVFANLSTGIAAGGTVGTNTLIGIEDLTGSAHNDRLVGDGGDNILTGGEGSDVLDGGAGFDTAKYLKDSLVHTLLFGEGGLPVQVVDRSASGDQDELSNIEVLEFTDGATPLGIFDSVQNLTEAQFSSFTEMYIAYFNRAPDSLGLMFWANAFAEGFPLEGIAEEFAVSAEALAAFPAGTTNSDFVANVYDNVLGRIPDLAGFNFWVDVLDASAVTRGQFVLEVLRGARADTPPGATQEFIDQQVLDVAFLDNKIDIGLYFSAWLGMSDVANATDVMNQFDGSAASISVAQQAALDDFNVASASDGTGEFLVQLRGVFDDPFAVA